MRSRKLNIEELVGLLEKNKVELIDVREEREYMVIRFKKAKLIPMHEILEKLDQIDWTRTVVFYCRTGSRSKDMVNIVNKYGKNAFNLSGGIKACYKDKNCGKYLTIEKEEKLDKYFN